MIKKILELLGYKVFTTKEYETLVSSVAKCGVYYRSLTDDLEYHHGGSVVTVKLTELANITLVENCIWDDVKERIYKEKSDD